MAYLVTDNCVMCKHTDCVEVCPVDCFYEGENFLAINPDECIDCGVCEPECPVDAIVPDNALDEAEREKWEEINRKYSLIWPVLTQKKDALPDAEKFNNVENKFETYFSDTPGEGDD
jgi:ferredoxin